MPDHAPAAFAAIFADPSQPTIIGGQAVNLWAEQFSERAPELSRFRPFLSRDADLWADRRTVVALRNRTGWTCHFYDEPRIHAVALLTKTIPDSPEPLRVEVLKNVYGLTHEDLAKSTIVTLSEGAPMRILDPAPLLKGKIATLTSFGAAERPNDVRHISLLIPIAREYLADRLAAVDAGQLPEREMIAAARYLAEILTTPAARAIAAAHKLDFSAAFPQSLAVSPSAKIRNFATLELPRTLTRGVRAAASAAPAPSVARPLPIPRPVRSPGYRAGPRLGL